jgi:hypothetical protein
MAVVYQHRRKDTNEIFYIGIGTKIERSRSRFGRNKYWINIVEKYGYTIEIVHNNISRKEAEKIETELINQYGRKDLGLGLLVNLTDGGEKPSNISDITKNILREKLKGNKNSLGMKHTEETKRLLSEGRKGDKHPLWNKISKKRGIPLSDETKIKNRESQPNRKKIKVINHKTNEIVSIYNGIGEMINKLFNQYKGTKEYRGLQSAISTIINKRPHRIWKGIPHYRKSYKGFRYELINE